MDSRYVVYICVPQNKSINFHWNFFLIFGVVFRLWFSAVFGRCVAAAACDVLAIAWYYLTVAALSPHTHTLAITKILSARAISSFANRSFIYRYFPRTHIPCGETHTAFYRLFVAFFRSFVLSLLGSLLQPWNINVEKCECVDSPSDSIQRDFTFTISCASLNGVPLDTHAEPT